jgi:hypothetical protein
VSRNAVLVIVFVVFGVWSARPVRADGPAGLDLDVAPCLVELEASLRAILVIELSTVAVIDDQTRDASLRATLDCEARGVVIRVTRVDTGEVLEERVDLARRDARTLALVLSELVAATRPPELPDPPPQSDPAPEAPRAKSLRIDGALVYRFGLDHGPRLGGLRVGAAYMMRRRLRLSAGVEWLAGARDTTLGRVIATSLSVDGAVGLAFTHDGSSAVLDFGVRAGTMLWNGNHASMDVAGARVAKPALGLFMRGVGELAVSERVCLRATLELGAVLVGSEATAVDATGTEVVIVDRVSADRVWSTLGLGLTYVP